MALFARRLLWVDVEQSGATTASVTVLLPAVHTCSNMLYRPPDNTSMIETLLQVATWLLVALVASSVVYLLYDTVAMFVTGEG